MYKLFEFHYNGRFIDTKLSVVNVIEQLCSKYAISYAQEASLKV